jgi:hypothetical protein
MLKADQVPNESILAVVARFPALFSNHDEVEAVIADAINAWPGKCTADTVMFPHIILPLIPK